jgi:hypothetical protein
MKAFVEKVSSDAARCDATERARAWLGDAWRT